ncbi:hypothetical protein JTB14_035763 [Gonioctena quinquepunctata]|nr:hypothetical protein JTB14_035763 [Gonioctena quinquepunctata]
MMKLNFSIISLGILFTPLSAFQVRRFGPPIIHHPPGCIMDASYVPNNPQFGLQLECNWSGSPAGIQQVTNCTDDLSSCWSEDMGSFSLPLDLEPLPSLFNISPCSNGTNGSYK